MGASSLLDTTLASPAKINLFLHITGRRADGYHLLQSVFCPISLADTIQLRVQRLATPALHIERTGDLLHIPPDKDLTVRALQAVYAAWAQHQSQGLRISLHVDKRIPEEAGLGGGSSNAATVLKALNTALGCPLDADLLHHSALQLGADVPFFLAQKPAFVEGIGEKITPMPGLQGQVLVFKPPISCPTHEIFRDPELTRDSKDVKIAVFDSASRLESGVNNQCLLSFLSSSTCNVLQTVVEKRRPEWQQYFNSFKQLVATANPLLVRMTGSGSAMFAVFASPSQLSSAQQAVSGNPLMQAGQVFGCSLLS
ncbi:4-(cytidine 5'-diphospho)-2-C-methyl-D-erythritol kinase [Limnobacter humi]|uniref:4-diphosphocytidyl-2-C-methyl-D-erythritol kinase n=1 Tax=Limnobacter humi TaxID=1778671 RepID=A0ABT1WL06_9BURK|nr:4-(cytidine 5'-diphospho)-2-C-methyl-D-erythritol kinase [Limnobacter humi]MCQ8897429.1 4-(cytidine 5'-diphospho)-2-C-methyl-D-erythritol kinase [Limnobacter humi]